MEAHGEAEDIGIAERRAVVIDPIKICIDGKTTTVPRAGYVWAKTKNLREFGYDDLTEREVDAQITAILEGKEMGEGLTVIGAFMEDEIVKP